MRRDTSGRVRDYTGSRCYSAHLWPSQLQLWRNAIKVSDASEGWNLGTLVCLGLICVYANGTVLWCVASVLYPGVYPGIRSWSANPGLLAAAGECQQM